MDSRQTSQPKVKAAIDALPPNQAAKVQEGIRMVVSDYDTTGKVSPAAIKAFAVGLQEDGGVHARRLPLAA